MRQCRLQEQLVLSKIQNRFPHRKFRLLLHLQQKLHQLYLQFHQQQQLEHSQLGPK